MSANTVAGTKAVPTCPGCHFGCRLDRYQCGRGQGIYEKWVETGEVPERPAVPPPILQLEVTDKLAFGMNILANVVQDQRSRRAEGEILCALMGHAGLASEQLIAARARLDSADFEKALKDLEAAGDIGRGACGHIRAAVWLTDSGRAKIPEAEAARRTDAETFLAPLSEDEREELDGLLFKLFDPRRREARQ